MHYKLLFDPQQGITRQPGLFDGAPGVVLEGFQVLLCFLP